MAIKTHEFNPKLTRKATLSLLSHTSSNRSSSSLPLDSDTVPVYLQFSLARIPQKPSLKPYRLTVPNPIYGLKEGDDLPEVCIFVKQER